MVDRRLRTVDFIIGVGIVVIAVVLVSRAGGAGYRQLFSRAISAASLSAQLDPPSTLKVTGDVQHAGKAVESGKVKLTVRRRHGLYGQSVMADIRQGRFEATTALQLGPPRESRPKLQVTAEIWPIGTEPLTERVYLNMRSPETATNALITLGVATALFLGVFFIAFTGRPSPRKNRIAIILSYCVILLFLALPLAAPLLVQRFFPDLQEAMNDSAVGIVITKPRGDVEKQTTTQWALNIGGYATRVDPNRSTPSASASRPPVDRTQSADAPPPPVSASTPGSTESAERTAPAAGSDLSAQANQGQTAPNNPSEPAEARVSDLIVNVEGGLVIPLYVILLSILGGAINMTRQVPKFQREGEGASVRMTKVVSRKVVETPNAQDTISGHQESTVSHTITTAAVADDAAAQHGNRYDDKVANGLRPAFFVGGVRYGAAPRMSAVSAASDTVKPTHTSAAPSAAQDVDEVQTTTKTLQVPADSRSETSDWRVGLLSQYMYLISAPFLAIAVFYLLSLVGVTEVPPLVVVAISIGLLSEAVVSRLLDMASGFLTRQPEPSQPRVQPEPSLAPEDASALPDNRPQSTQSGVPQLPKTTVNAEPPRTPRVQLPPGQNARAGRNRLDSLALLTFGARGAEVHILQSLLASQGYFHDSVTGDFRSSTRDAVVYFQQTHLGPDGAPLAVDGKVGKNTWWALHNPSGQPQRSGLTAKIPVGLGSMRTRQLEIAVAEHELGVCESPDGANWGGGVIKYLEGAPARWCCYFWSWCGHQCFGKYPLRHHEGNCLQAWKQATALGFAKPKATYAPIPGDAFVLLHSGRDDAGRPKITGHIGFVLRVEMSAGKAVAINTVEGNCGNRVKVGRRSLLDSDLDRDLVGYINPFDLADQPGNWETGLIAARSNRGDSIV